MSVRAVTILSAILATVLAIFVPVAQLQTSKIVVTCCCPDPDNCHCPKDTSSHDGRPTMRECHHENHDLVAPDAPVVDVVAIAIQPPIYRSVIAPLPQPSSPHASPDPHRPTAPS